jgi:hypothetical protein
MSDFFDNSPMEVMRKEIFNLNVMVGVLIDMLTPDQIQVFRSLCERKVSELKLKIASHDDQTEKSPE